MVKRCFMLGVGLLVGHVYAMEEGVVRVTITDPVHQGEHRKSGDGFGALVETKRNRLHGVADDMSDLEGFDQQGKLEKERLALIQAHLKKSKEQFGLPDECLPHLEKGLSRLKSQDFAAKGRCSARAGRGQKAPRGTVRPKPVKPAPRIEEIEEDIASEDTQDAVEQPEEAVDDPIASIVDSSPKVLSEVIGALTALSQKNKEELALKDRIHEEANARSGKLAAANKWSTTGGVLLGGLGGLGGVGVGLYSCIELYLKLSGKSC